MIGPRFLFAAFVCVRCLFVDDVVWRKFLTKRGSDFALGRGLRRPGSHRKGTPDFFFVFRRLSAIRTIGCMCSINGKD